VEYVSPNLAEDGPEISGGLLVRLERRVEAFDQKDGHPVRLAISVGPVDWETGEQVTLQELNERADQRMYDVKRAKRTA
jgi:GGDEF domain-containing protein